MSLQITISDLIVDRVTSGFADRLVPEAPVIVFQAERDSDDVVRLGGGAVAPWLLAGWGEAVSAAGVVGDDANGREVQRLLNESGVATDLMLVDLSRPTTCKHRFFGRAAISAGTATFGQCFTLDATGNWGGFRQDNNGDGTWDLVQSRTSNTVNEITGVTNSTGTVWTAPAYNLAGNQLRPPSDQRGSRTEAIA